jgi:hypothetical protein
MTVLDSFRLDGKVAVVTGGNRVSASHLRVRSVRRAPRS